ncbi:MAG: FKBP-type peptidyl-prolyl cis-trans isomerase [Thermoproteota archaeon]
MAIQDGDIVKVHYDAKVDDEVIDTSRKRAPIEFEVGEGQVLPGLDEGVVGLEKGEKKTLVVPPEEGYGKRKEGLTKELPLTRFKEPAQEIKEGMVLRYQTEKGHVGIATIEEIKENSAILDLNHPLAGQTIKFEIEVMDVQ